jgi:hypothetical protein
VSIKARVGWVWMNKLRWKLSYNTSWVYIGIVHGPPMDARHGITWKMCTRVRWVLIISFTTSWTMATRGAFVAHVCRFVRFYPLQGILLIRIFTTPSDMGGGLLAESKHSNWTSFMIHMAYEMDVVDDNHLYQTCLNLFSIGCKPIMITTLTWLKLA